MKDPKDDEKGGGFMDGIIDAVFDVFDFRILSTCAANVRLRIVVASTDPIPGLKVTTGPTLSVESGR